MKFFLFVYVLFIFILNINGFLHAKKPTTTTSDHKVHANVKIYSNLAEIITPIGKLPLEFSQDDWNDIRSDSITLVGTNISIKQQTITEKKNSLNNVEVYVRSPSSSNSETKFVKATMIDEKRNLVKLIDKDISKEPIYFLVSSDQIVYENEPPQSKYYVNFTYDTTDAVYLSYLRSNLNWKIHYQLNLFDEPKSPILTAMANIRNDGQSKVDIEHAELLGGDINLQMTQKHYMARGGSRSSAASFSKTSSMSSDSSKPYLEEGEEIAGLYVFAINQPFSIEGKTNYLLPMFQPQVTIERYSSFSKHFHGTAKNSQGKSQRSYRLTSNRYLSNGNCIIRESDRLVGETFLPNLAAKDKHEFSLGEDADIIYKENATLISTRTYNETSRTNHRDIHARTESVYNINILFKNLKKNRPVKIEYEQHIHGVSVKLDKTNTICTQDGSKIKCSITLSADSEKLVSYKFEHIH